LLHSSHPPEDHHPEISMEPVTPATEVMKQPTNPTKMMVCLEGILMAVVMDEVCLEKLNGHFASLNLSFPIGCAGVVLSGLTSLQSLTRSKW
jgi:hypothetical protein